MENLGFRFTMYHSVFLKIKKKKCFSEQIVSFLICSFLSIELFLTIENDK